MSKTYLDDLFDKYPHCIMLKWGHLRICRSVLYEGKYCDGSHGYDCCNCWHEEMREDAPDGYNADEPRERIDSYAKE